MGVGASNVVERILASVGEFSDKKPEFLPALDLANGGVLLAVPALLALGLLRHTRDFFQLPKGYYGIESIFLLLAFMALSRLKSMEALRYSAPGEWGKLLGLDRVPEVRTLRAKIRLLADQEMEQEWSAKLCKEWMENAPESTGVLYIDGHVRVYHGDQTKLPRHYVTREKLCLRATTDYWVNAMDGQPFFKINKAVDPGLIKVLADEIVPHLKSIIPNQPSEEALKANPHLHRFTLVFDREGYSPDLFLELKKSRIACLSYHKHPGPNWTHDEFSEHQVEILDRGPASLMIAERGTRLSNGLWLRECRKLSKDGHQTSIISTDYISPLGPITGNMTARWSQENFFKYMRQHFSLDMLIDHKTQPIDETTKVVNPEYRDLEGKIRRQAAILSRLHAEFGSTNLEDEIEAKKVEQFEKKKASLLEAITTTKAELFALKEKRKETPHHITIAELPEDKKFLQLSTHSKHLLDTIKMIAYRAETAMANIARESMSRLDDVHTLLRSIYTQAADILPDDEKKVLHVRLHNGANHATDQTIAALCKELTDTETLFPGTDLKLVYSLVSNQIPRGQDVWCATRRTLIGVKSPKGKRGPPYPESESWAYGGDDMS